MHTPLPLPLALFTATCLTLAAACVPTETPETPETPVAAQPSFVEAVSTQDTLPAYQKAFAAQPDRIATTWQFPVGPPLAKGYYNAQPFGENDHLGDDWNGTGGGNSDLGDPVYAAASGWVGQSLDHGGGWGKVIRVVHRLPATDSLEFVETLYAHLDSMLVSRGEWVEAGQQIGTIGNADGAYWAHLHFELRNAPRRPLGGGYGRPNGYLDPTAWIKAKQAGR